MLSTSVVSVVTAPVSLMWSGRSFRYSRRYISALCVLGNIPKMSSMYRPSSSGGSSSGSVFCNSVSIMDSSYSSSAKYIHAYVTANGVPIAVPDICR